MSTTSDLPTVTFEIDIYTLQVAETLASLQTSPVLSSSQPMPVDPRTAQGIPTNPDDRREYHKYQALVTYGGYRPKSNEALAIMAAIHHHKRPAPTIEMLEDLGFDGADLGDAGCVAGETIISCANFFAQTQVVLKFLANDADIRDEARDLVNKHNVEQSVFPSKWSDMTPVAARERFVDLMKDLQLTSTWACALNDALRRLGLLD